MVVKSTKSLFKLCTEFQSKKYKAIVSHTTIVFARFIITEWIYTLAYGGDWNGFIIAVLTRKCCYTFYFIFVYAQLVLLTPLIIKLLKSKYSWLGWVITPLCYLFFRYGFVILGIVNPFPLDGTLFAYWFLYYYMGLAIGNQKIKYELKVGKIIFLYVVCLILSSAEAFLWNQVCNYDMATTQLRFGSMLTNIPFLLIADQYIRESKFRDTIITKGMIFLGNQSFGIYLSHVLIISVLEKLPRYGDLLYPLTTIIVILLSSFCSYAGYKILAKKSWILGL